MTLMMSVREYSLSDAHQIYRQLSSLDTHDNFYMVRWANFYFDDL